MNHGPILFFGILVAMLGSWYGLVVVPQIQVGRQAEVAIPPSGFRYPFQRPGQAEEGKQVYQANGCYYCHTQVVRAHAAFNLLLTDAGDQGTALASALAAVKPGLSQAAASTLAASAPAPVLEAVSRKDALEAAKRLEAAGAKVSIVLAYQGADIKRGWGDRFSVAQDYLYDQPVLLGTMRLGPDLANVGARLSDRQWHLMRLYNPQTVAKGSSMPAYPYLFEKRKAGKVPSPDALRLTGEFAPEAGYEIVPTPEANALVSYLLSLKTETSLFEAPLPNPPKPTETGATNQVSAAAPIAGEGLAMHFPRP